MASGNAENKSAFESGIFLKVDSVEPVYNITFSCSGEPPLSGIKVWINGSGYFFECNHYTVCDPDVVREDGRRQVVALAKELTNMKYTDRTEMFGFCTVADIVSHFSYEEINEKLDVWRKRKDIRVRDEVYSKAQKVSFVITKISTPSGSEDAIVSGLKKDGTAVKGLLLCNLRKTGLHVDDLDSYLEV